MRRRTAEPLERCRQGFYPSPESYDRTQNRCYCVERKATLSAVTHVRRSPERQTRGGPGPIYGMTGRPLTDPFRRRHRRGVRTGRPRAARSSCRKRPARPPRRVVLHYDDLRTADTLSALAATATTGTGADSPRSVPVSVPRVQTGSARTDDECRSTPRSEITASRCASGPARCGGT